MNSTKRFVVGVDGSDHARRALRWAIDEAVTWNAELDVVHAWDVPIAIVPSPIRIAGLNVDQLEEAARALLDAEVAAALGGDGDAGPRIEKIVVQDAAAGALVETANGADLLVVGSRGHGTFRGALLGSRTKC